MVQCPNLMLLNRSSAVPVEITLMILELWSRLLRLLLLHTAVAEGLWLLLLELLLADHGFRVGDGLAVGQVL